MLLKSYCDKLKRAGICVIFHEELSERPSSEMVEICAFAVIDAGFYNVYNLEVYNLAKGKKPPKIHGFYRNLKYASRRYTHDKRLPYSHLKGVKSAIEPACTLLGPSLDGKVSISGSTEQFLIEYYCDGGGLIEELTGRPAPPRTAA